MRKEKLILAAAAVIFGVGASNLNAGLIQPTSIVVEQVGGTASSASAVFIDEYAKTGLQVSPIQSIAMPTSASGASAALTESGSATSDGYLSRSADGTVLVVPGYNAPVGTASVASTAPGSTARTIGVVMPDGSVDTTHTVTDGPSSNFRSVTSNNGSQFWLATQGATGASPTPGVQYSSGTGTTTTGVQTGNVRNVEIFGGQLFVSSSSAAAGSPGVGITPLGALPTGAGTPSPTIAAAYGTGTPSPYAYWFLDLNSNDYLGTGMDTLYVADDRSNANGGGLDRFNFDGSNWNFAYQLKNGLTTGLRGLAGEVVGGNPVLYATDATASANGLWAVTDTGSGSTFSELAVAPAGSVFRGVVLAPVPAPEPTSAVMLGAAGLLYLARRKRS